MLKNFVLLALTLSVSCAGAAQSIIQIFSATSAPNYQYPWQSGKIEEHSGSGIVIGEQRIITSAHVVSNAKFIQVSKENSSKKYIAHVKYISHQADLAILEVQDKSFFEGTHALEFTTEIKQGDPITVLGYPLGGQTISTTKGIISRIEPSRYTWSGENLLAIQVDAAVNTGNSGGAALNQKGEIVGISMQTYTKANNISYIVPSLIVNSFLVDIKDGKVDGYDNAKTAFQPLINETLKKHYGISNDIGVVISHLDKNENTLQLGDILLSIDNNPVYNDGTIKTSYGIMKYTFALHTKPVGDTITMKVVREKKQSNFFIHSKKPITLFIQKRIHFLVI